MDFQEIICVILWLAEEINKIIYDGRRRQMALNTFTASLSVTYVVLSIVLVWGISYFVPHMEVVFI